MKDAIYSVIIMQDSAQVRRFRIRKFWVLGAAGCAILITLTAVFGIVFGTTYGTKYAILYRERQETIKRMREAEIQAERLKNVQQILASYDQEEIATLINNCAVTPRKAKVAAGTELSDIFAPVDLNLINVSNMQARINGQSFQVICEINNLQATGAIVGEFRFALVTREGKILDIEDRPADAAFEIQKFKRVQTAFILPGSITRNDIFALRVKINNKSGSVVFSETYPLSVILS